MVNFFGAVHAYKQDQAAVDYTLPADYGSYSLSFGEKTLLQQSDFTYLGSFTLQNVYPAAAVGSCLGLTHRYRGGQLRFLMVSGRDNSIPSYQLLEYTPSSYGSGPGYYPDATMTKNYGDMFSGLFGWPDVGTGVDCTGLLWDETTQKLLWAILPSYTGTTSQSIGVATLNDGASTASSVGRYGTPLGYKATKGFLHIPAAAAASIGGGRRIGAGFGSYESLVTSGGPSLGPALTAFNPSDLYALSSGQSLSGAQSPVLANHPWQETPYADPQRARRNANYKTEFDGWHPQGSVGYWTWSDHCLQSAIWIDTGMKHGAIWFVRQVLGGQTATVDSGFTPVSLGSHRWTVRVTSTLASARNGDYINYPGMGSATLESGATGTEWTILGWPGVTNPNPTPATSGTTYRGAWYYDSKGWSTAGQLAAMFYDPAELLAANSNPLPYYAEATWAVPEVATPFTSWQNVGGNTVVGATFDETTNRLYLMWRNQYTPAGQNFSLPVVSAYQVA